MSFPKYPAYKDSGVEWLREVPAHWEVGSLKHSLIELVSGGTPESSNPDYWAESDGISWVSISDMTKSFLVERTERSLSHAGLKSKGLRILPAGTLVYSMYASIGKVALLGIDAVTNQAILGLMLDEKNVTQGFIRWWLSGLEPWVKTIASSNTQDNLNAEKVRNLPVVFPPTIEQTQIARFLDHETARIDALIEEQQRLIELLKEKRQAVISHAVTKGLDPSVAMKDSGVEWLGEVPAHWSILQVGRVCRKVSDGPHFSPDYVDEGVLFLSARNIAVDGWHLEDAKFVSEEDYLEFCRRITPEKGDVLYTKGGTTGIARVVDLDERFQVWVHVAVLKLDRDLVDPYYMAFSLNSTGCYEQSQLHTRGATNQDLGLTRMTKIWFALPPLEEQTKICDFLNLELGNIDSLSSEATTVMELLTERRTALISAAVTGKIDLRGWQPPTSTPAPLREQETA